MSADENELWGDVVGDASPADFRDAVLMETLLGAKRRRWRRQITRAVATTVCVAAGALLTRSLHSPPAANRGYTVVTTQPLPSNALVSTRNSVSAPGQEVASIPVVHTARSDLRFLTDRQLFALVPNAAIVRVGSAPPELILR